MKLRLSPRARQDIEEIGRYIRLRNPLAARMVRDAIRRSLDVLATHPYSGRAFGRAGRKRLVVPRLPYLIFYRVDVASDSVLIVTIRHASRREEN